ncbi:MAG: hypothetical protein H7282_03975 [Cytophagaceae bacterium]|nr:hypothetical protein [Cytophagaceae bacterium]
MRSLRLLIYYANEQNEKAALETRAAFLVPDKGTYVAGSMELILNELYYAVAFIPNLLPIKLKTPTANTGLLIKKYEALAMARPSAILDVVGDK